jgi:flagellar basal-body rod protein FlgB
MDNISTALVVKALDGLTLRYQATAQNIANANSPGYRPVRVRFEDSLRSAAAHGLQAIADVKPKVELAPAPRIASEMRMDLEIANASQTAMRYGALITLLSREMALARTVLSGGR